MIKEQNDWYCCKKMEEADKEQVIDFCKGNLTTLDCKKGWAYPIFYCPFCGKEIDGSLSAHLRIEAAVIEHDH